MSKKLNFAELRSSGNVTVDCGLPIHTKALLSTFSSRSNAGPYEDHTIGQYHFFKNKHLVIHPSVSPVLPSSKCYLSYLSETIVLGKKVLDYGCGSGVLSIASAILGAYCVDAIDILPEAVACTSFNTKRLGMTDIVKVFESDGFSKACSQYDLILANLPIVRIQEKPKYHNFGLLDPQFSIHDYFLQNYRHHLLPGGSALICHAPLQYDNGFDVFERYLVHKKASFRCAFELDQDGLTWRLYRLD